MATPEKYGHIKFTPPSGAKREAEKALAWRREFGRGATAVGIARARDISNGTELSPSTVRRMKAFFDRHDSDQKAEGFRLGEKGYPSNGRIAWAAWGGDTGRSWANKVVSQMNAADEKATRSTDIHSGTTESRSNSMQNIERRYLAFDPSSSDDSIKVEKRADPLTGKPATYLIGYAAKFGATSLLLGDFYERISPTAFEIVEKRKDLDGFPLETRGLFNHDPNELLGRFPTTMNLTVDDVGLKYEIKLPETRRDIAELVERGDLKGSSFSFVCAEGGEKWSMENGKSIRLVTKIKTLLDAGPVTYPAYRDSSVAVAKRSYEHHMQTVSKLGAAKARAAAVSAKMQEFIERRSGDCGRDEGGKFGSGNKCQGGGDSPSVADKLRGPASTATGAIAWGLLGAAAGALAGPAGIAAGAAVGGVLGAIGGKNAGEKSAKIYESIRDAAGLTDDSVREASKLIGQGGGVFVNDDHSFVIASSSGGELAVVGKKAVEYHAWKADADTIAKATKVAKTLGSGELHMHASSKEDETSLKKAGFIKHPKDPEVYVKKLPRTSKRSQEHRAQGNATNAGGGAVSGGGDCGREDGGKFGSGNKCQANAGEGKYMEWKKGDHKDSGKAEKAQKFIDKARKDQTISAGKSGGKSDDGGGVQTWSKGDHFPWVVKQVGHDNGHLQGIHPDGSRTEKYPFTNGDSTEAMQKIRAEIESKKQSKRSLTPGETVRGITHFLRNRHK